MGLQRRGDGAPRADVAYGDGHDPGRRSIRSATFALAVLLAVLVGGDRIGASPRTGRPRVVLPNLVVSELTNPPASVKRGGQWDYTETTANTGGAASGTTTDTRYYLSTDTVKDAGDRRIPPGRGVPSLAAGATNTKNRTLVVPSDMPLGTYYMLACADDVFEVTEANETDNCRATTTTVTVKAPK
jgi:hypothetical protein